MHSVLKYPGAKYGVADWIVGMMPPHKSYLEPFFGSGAVFFNKQRSAIETVNDLDGEVMNLFRVIREQPEQLAALLALTPYSRQEYEEAWQLRGGQNNFSALEQARLLLVRYWQTHGCSSYKKAGWKNDVAGREAAYAVRDWNRLPNWVMGAADRLKDAQIEHSSALELIPRFHDASVLIYADPPYVLDTRQQRRKMYCEEMTNADHERLLRVLMAHPGPVMLSGYDCELYNDLLPGSIWTKYQHAAQAQHGAVRTETLWVNFEVQLRLDL